jgi:pilus assembly protein Flp/PilA
VILSQLPLPSTDCYQTEGSFNTFRLRSTKSMKGMVGQMTTIILRLKIWKDTKGQDLIEYALMAGFVAVAAGAIMPGVAESISTIFSQIGSVMSTSSSNG